MGFFLLIKKLTPEPTISLDLDWFYRQGGRLLLWTARRPIQWVDTGVSELYRVAGLIPLMGTARLAGRFDNRIIDGAVDGFAQGIRSLGGRLRQAQRGQLQENISLALAGLVVIGLALLFIYLF